MMTTGKNIRYDRQQRIQNWNQEKLAGARVAIVGAGQLAQFTAASLVALGIGNVEIYDEGKNSGFLTSLGKQDGVTLENRLHKMNPDIDVKRFGFGREIDGEPDLILDLTNSPESKGRILRHAASQGIAVVSASTGETGGELHFVKSGEDRSEAGLVRYSGETQGAFSSEVLGGMITEEVRKFLMPLKEGEEAVRNLAYHATAERRFSKRKDFDAQPFEDLSQKKVLIVGAGALGNFAALGAALEGIGKIDILDYDEVEAHNLNRQIMFYDSVGKAKALALAERIREINPDVEVMGLVGKLDENTTYFSNNKPDLILDCVDNFATRAITNYFAIHHGIPLVSGGTNSHSGQVVVYEPGRSSCLECKLGVERALGMALQGSKCTNEPDPSVIMTNEVIGGMMVGEALKVLDKGYGAPKCSRGDIKGWLQEVKDRFSLVAEDTK